MLSDYALLTGAPTAADQAVGLTPSDPEAHFTRANVYLNADANDEAIREYERAVQLRPRDYYLWLSLADALDQVGQPERALAASREAVRLAPFYAQPHWELGNLLFRAGSTDEGFAELRRAALSDSSLLPSVIDLAWGSSNNSPQKVEELIQPQTNTARVDLALFYSKHGKASDAVRLFRAAGEVSDKDRRALINDLLASRKFKDAHEIWLSGHQAPPAENAQGTPLLVDGGFEKSVSLDDPGFGWQLVRDVPSVSFAVDKSERREGLRSLRVDWNGDYNPLTPVFGQLILVEPKTHYRLHFAARAKEVVTGGPPLFVVGDASSSSGNRQLAQSKPLPQGTGDWNDYTLEFITGNETEAITISLQRETCAGGPCPIFGHTWLDDFSLEKM